jgi:hypothetical protein
MEIHACSGNQVAFKCDHCDTYIPPLLVFYDGKLHYHVECFVELNKKFPKVLIEMEVK